jgi:hypothetical protein
MHSGKKRQWVMKNTKILRYLWSTVVYLKEDLNICYTDKLSLNGSCVPFHVPSFIKPVIAVGKKVLFNCCLRCCSVALI